MSEPTDDRDGRDGLADNNSEEEHLQQAPSDEDTQHHAAEEALKMYFELFKHMTTVSTASILVVLTIYNTVLNVGTAVKGPSVVLLAGPPLCMAIALVSSVWGMRDTMMSLQLSDLSQARDPFKAPYPYYLSVSTVSSYLAGLLSVSAVFFLTAVQ